MKKYKYYFLAIFSLLLVSSCVPGYKVEREISTDEINLVKNTLHNISIDSIDVSIYEASFLNRNRWKYKYGLSIYASNDTLSEVCLRKKIDEIVKAMTVLMSKNKMRLYSLTTFYSSENRSIILFYDIDKNLKAHLNN